MWSTVCESIQNDRSTTGEQGWHSGESTRLPPMWPGIDSWILRHMWVEFVGFLLCSERFFPRVLRFSPLSSKKTKQKQNKKNPKIACVAQLASARLSEQRVHSSILGDFNVCFDFLLIRVTIALNIRETEHWQRGRKGVKDALAASINWYHLTDESVMRSASFVPLMNHVSVSPSSLILVS